MQVIEFGLEDKGLRERYDRLFESCPGAFVQQSTFWAEVIKDLGPDRPIFLLCRDGADDVAGLPLYLYEHGRGSILTSVPQAGPLGGIFTRADVTSVRKAAVYRALVEAAQAVAERYSCLALTLISNPFEDDLDLYEQSLAPTFVLENHTQYILLDRATPWSHGHRNNVNRARRAGYVAEPCRTQDGLRTWCRIHRRRHSELGVTPLPPELFENAFRILVPRGKAEVILVRSGNEVVAGGLYLRHRDVIDVFMLSGAPEHLARGANFLNTEYSLHWARQSGARIYNWQSSPRREGGVYSYKQQWGSSAAVYSFVTRLFVPSRTIQEMGLETLRAQYAWHYVLPYAAFDEGFDRKYFVKA